jgi:uncharacterized protein with WD repeat
VAAVHPASRQIADPNTGMLRDDWRTALIAALRDIDTLKDKIAEM